MGLETLGTSPDQGAGIERVRAKLRASMEPLHTAHRRLLATLADGLSSGTLNPSTVDAAVLGVSSAALAVRDALASSLNDLHAVLTPSQRTAMADKVEAHWSVWRAENVGSQGALPGTEQGHLSALTTELDLSPAQQEKIRETLKSERTEGPPFDQQQAGARLHALAEAFGQQHFDARAIEQSGPEPGMAAWGAAHLARVVEAMSPVLSAEQRSQLAEKLREHAGHAGVVEGSS
jgi:Spy/CpxP family protein refolding chaperone